jgi:kynureninase
VRGHFEGAHPWLPYHELLTEPMARLIGALPSEVVMMNSLTANLHLMMVTFYRPTPERHKILIESRAFPSDRYAVESQVGVHGFDAKSSLVVASPHQGEDHLRIDDLLARIDREGPSIALILLPGVQYYTGQAFDMAAITRAAHRQGCRVGFDLAHAAGNLHLSLHDDGPDFAVWCSYKYLNSGPGSVGGCFVHERHARDRTLPRFAGWWGHDKSTRFLMGDEFDPIPTAEGWQLSNPPILSLAAIHASLDVFSEAGGMQPLREKSAKLTGYLEQLLRTELANEIEIITPAERGCQLSLRSRLEGRHLFEQLEARGVTCDWREPNVTRVAPVPLYNRFVDVARFVEILKSIHEAR